MNIRLFQPEDYDKVFQLWKEVFPENTDSSYSRKDVERFLERNPETSFVALDENENIIGAVLAGHDGRRGYIYHLGIREGFRSSGIGKKLVQAALDVFGRLGIRKAQLSVFDSNVSAKEFYKKLGFKVRTELNVLTVDILK
ncbi:MAG: GNAT family N-acetyltransferase [Bacillota bacterium]|nr:GNAT family N-acetyltransferase [Bacillota bacterium]